MPHQPAAKTFIDPIPPEDLERAANASAATGARSRAPFPPALAQAEMDYVKAWRRERGGNQGPGSDDKLVGLALSGGGIRSAAFALGVMQALASKDLLDKVDYLSTVSGGGYIGAALTWLTSRQAQHERAPDRPHASGHGTGTGTRQDLPCFGFGRDDFPFGSDDPRPDAARRASDEQRRMLRYLREHGCYLTPGSGINALSLLGVVLRGTFLNLVVWMPVFVFFFLFGLWFFGRHNPGVYAMVVLPRLMTIGDHAELFGFELFLWVGLGLLALLMVGTLIYSVLTKVRRRSTGWFVQFWYLARRLTERFSASLIATIALLLLVGCLPAISAQLKDAFMATGPLAMLAGMGMAMRSFLSPTAKGQPIGPDLTASLAAGLVLFGGFLIAYEIAYWLYQQDDVIPIAAVLAAVSLLVGWLANINYTSIHRYYRDRLMETFMPDIARALGDKTGAALDADVARLSDIIALDKPRGPYHILNTNLVLVDSAKRAYCSRGGDNFILSPLYCGSNATGWCPTTDFCQGKMTLATAVAISGAAINPNTGVGGTGLTRAHLVSFVMALLDLRLGYWAGHPAPDRRPRHSPNHFLPGAYAFGSLTGLDSLGFNERRGFLQLSDGGHFENTGVYELVRRRARLILVCDGGEDGRFSFSDFRIMVQRIEEDFGVRIKALDDASPDLMMPAVPKQPCFPLDARFSQQGHLVGCIFYPDNTRGWLIYLKATLTKSMSFKVKGYAAEHPQFPHESTIDQFFDEVQFDAYRELGYQLAADMLAAPVPAALAAAAGLPRVSGTTAAPTLDAVIHACGV